MSAQRILIMAEMHGRDLLRRHVALALLVALPLSFYLASAGGGQGAVATGGVGMSFAVSGASLFSVLSSRAADQRLVLSGYRPFEMLLGRLLFLGPLALVISAGFSAVMAVASQPTRPWVMALGVAVAALQSVPFGLAVGSAVPRELEGTLVLIGVVGIQLATHIDTVASQVLPFYGPRRLLEASLRHHGAIALPLFQTFVYGLALLIAARLFVARRVDVARHGPVRGSRRAHPAKRPMNLPPAPADRAERAAVEPSPSPEPPVDRSGRAAVDPSPAPRRRPAERFPARDPSPDPSPIRLPDRPPAGDRERDARRGQSAAQA